MHENREKIKRKGRILAQVAQGVMTLLYFVMMMTVITFGHHSTPFTS